MIGATNMMITQQITNMTTPIVSNMDTYVPTIGTQSRRPRMMAAGGTS